MMRQAFKNKINRLYQDQFKQSCSLYKIKKTSFHMSTQNQNTFIESHILRRFNVLKKVGSGAYGHVWKVQQKSTKRILALKKIFDAFQHATDAQRTYRQIQILRQLDHPNIIKLHETIRADNNRDVYVLFEFMEADLHNVIAQNILKDVHIRFIIYQLAKALKYLHTGKVIHRDLKPSNILVNSNCTIKLCDFGLVRSLHHSKDQGAVLTEGVATRWYRSPEVLLGSKSYSTPADLWSFGCIIYQILAQKPLFNGSCTLQQIQKICSFTGYPSEEDINSLESEVSRSMIKQMKIPLSSKPASILKDFPACYVDLLERILVFNPNKRITIDQILSHELVKSFRKIEEEISCNKEISTSVDDNKKFTVDQYRKFVYGANYIDSKPKALSASLGAGSVSPKYTPQNANKTTVNFAPNKPDYKPQIAKKYSYEKLKNPQVNYSDQSSKKVPEKQSIRYIRSANNIVKGQNLYPQYQKKDQTTINYEIPNRQQLDNHPSQVYDQKIIHNTNHSPKYVMHQKYPIQFTHNRHTQSNSLPISVNSSLNSSTNPLAQTAVNWKPKPITTQTILSTNQIKDKVLQFRSPKYANYSKQGDFIPKVGIMQEGNKKCY